MIEVPCKTGSTISAESLNSINRTTSSALDSGSIGVINRNILNSGANKGTQSAGQIPQQSPGQPAQRSAGQSAMPAAGIRQTQQNLPAESTPVRMRIPSLLNPVQKGQKIPISSPDVTSLDIRIGWNTSNPDCDIDVSAFMLGEWDKVIGDSWFVFYSQPDSPDRSLHFSQNSREDRQEMTVDLSKIDSRVKKIVFVLTIYEAASKNLNFSMVSDAYIRLLESASKKEIASFKMNEYYSEVRSMMIGEVYEHKGIWKFNAVGNGIAGELDGLCRLYGVELQ